MAGVSLDGLSEVEPLRQLYGHDLEHWLIDHLDLTAGETALELASGLGAMCVRLAEVAKKVGVSEATVSRVLNGRAGVSDSTREAVLTALDVLGYERPTQLRGERARLIGLVLPELSNPIFPALAEIATVKKGRSYAPGGTRHSVGETRGAFQESVDALKGGAGEISFARPYTTDFLGWFDDFSTTGGGFDALGATARGFITMSEFLHKDSLAYKQYKRCPGAAEPPAKDGSNVLSQEEQDRLDCEDGDRGTPQ